MFALAATHKWHLQKLYVNDAFLHGDLQEDVYMKIPPGFQVSNPNQVCKLHKSLYDLKQESRQWNAKLISLLIPLGYAQSKTGDSLLVKTANSHITILLIYVDDIVLIGNKLTEI